MERTRRRLDLRRPTDVPTVRIPLITTADIAAEYRRRQLEELDEQAAEEQRARAGGAR